MKMPAAADHRPGPAHTGLFPEGAPLWAWALAIACALAMAACGVDPGAQYGRKSYGERDLRGAGVDGGKNGPGGRGPGDGGEATPDGDGAGDEALSPDALVLNALFRAALDPESATRLADGKEPSTNFGLASKAVKDRLKGGTREDGIITQQTFGDGLRYSDGRQTIVNTVGDREAAAKPGTSSESGLQTYRRVTGDACPAVLICVDRLRFTPTAGTPVTVCFQDTAGKPVAVPYAVAPNYAAADFEPYYKTYGPFVAKRFEGSDVDCAQLPGDGVRQEIFQTVVAKGTNQTTKVFQKADAPAADFEVLMRNERVQGDNVAPYLDETVRLQYVTRYFLSAEKKKLVKMLKRVRKSAELPAVIGVFLPMNGLMVNLHLELCEDRMAGEAYCN